MFAGSTPTRRVVLIANAASAMGSAVALDFAREHASVVLAGPRIDELHACADKVRAAGGTPTVVHCDPSSDTERSTLVGYTLRLHRRLDILINELAPLPAAETGATAEETWRFLDQEFTVMLDLALLAVPQMRRVGRGVIVNISSIGERNERGDGLGPYYAGQFLVRALSAALRRHVRNDAIEIVAAYRADADQRVVQRSTSWRQFEAFDAYNFVTCSESTDATIVAEIDTDLNAIGSTTLLACLPSVGLLARRVPSGRLLRGSSDEKGNSRTHN